MAMLWDLTRGFCWGFLPGILPLFPFLRSVMKGENKQKTTTTHTLGKSPHSLHPKKVRSSSMTLMAHFEWSFGVCVRVLFWGEMQNTLSPPLHLPHQTSFVRHILRLVFLCPFCTMCGLTQNHTIQFSLFWHV
jgi:hypothetical protein